MPQAERHRRSQPHAATRHRRTRVRLGLGRLALGQDARRPHREHPSGLGQRETARGAVDQLLPKPRLQPLHRLRHGRSGQAEFRRGGGEGAGFGHLGEDRPGFQIWQGHCDRPPNRKRCLSILSVFGASVEAHVSAGRTRTGATRMIERRKFAELGGADHGWLKAKHHFSFANYYDPHADGLGRAAGLERRRDRREVGLSAASARRHGDHHLCPRGRHHAQGLDGQHRPHRGGRRAGDVGRFRRASLGVQPGGRDDADLPDLDRADRARRQAVLGREAVPQGRPLRPVRDVGQRHGRRRRGAADPRRCPRDGCARSRRASASVCRWIRRGMPTLCLPPVRSRSAACASTHATARRSPTSSSIDIVGLEDAEVVLVDAA